MTPEAKAVLEYQIGEVLRCFWVGTDAEATGALRASKGFRCATVLYAVWDRRVSPSRKVSDPGPHLQAQGDRIRLQTAAIIQLIEEAERVSPAD